MRRRRRAETKSEEEPKTEFNPMYEFHEDVKTMLLINGNDTCDENYVFPSNPVLFRYGQYYFDDGTRAPYRIEATDQNPDYESSTS